MSIDVIVVGLGWVGLSTSYYWAKQGLKVLGLEMNSISGEIGTSSCGYTRAYRFHDPNPVKNQMMQESRILWEEVESELQYLRYNPEIDEDYMLQTELLTQSDYLVFGKPDHPYIVDKIATNPEEKWISASEICEKYPDLKNLPDDYIGTISHDAGQVRVQHALTGYTRLCQKYGAELLYNSEVSEVFNDHVILKDGTQYNAKQVVVWCGGYSTETFDKEHAQAEMINTETIVFEGDTKEMPGVIYECIDDNFWIYGLRDGQNLEEYKVGIHGAKDFKKVMGWFRNRLPHMIKHIKYTAPWFYSQTEDEKFVYKTNPDGVHYVYGLCGEGFKFMPFHGKLVYDSLISKEDTHFLSFIKAKM